MRVGWLADDPGYTGGAEMNAAAFAAGAPDGVEVIECPPDNIDATCDAYVIHNCTEYSRWIIPKIQGRPIFKMVHDVWPHGDIELRRWLTVNAHIITVTPLLADRVNFTMTSAYDIPSPINWGAFESDNLNRNGRAVWVGRLVSSKGVENAIQWANANDVTLDIYGFGETSLAGEYYRGAIDNAALPALLSDYSQFVFLPDAFDPCPRTSLEAYAAGCELVLNDNVGSQYWITQRPDAIRTAVADFWEAVTNA